MTVWTLKLIAVITMLVDHIGALLLPNVLLLRIIGRIAFPIFAFLIAESMTHTRNRKRYLLRVFFFALITELPFRLSILGGNWGFGLRNVLFTLLFGALACLCWANGQKQPWWYIAAFLPVIAAELFFTDYGAFGAAAILLFFALRPQPKILTCAVFAVWTVFYCIAHLNMLELYALFALPLLYFYNGQKGAHSAKYFFYVFYPAHLLLLWGISFL